MPQDNGLFVLAHKKRGRRLGNDKILVRCVISNDTECKIIPWIIPQGEFNKAVMSISSYRLVISGKYPVSFLLCLELFFLFHFICDQAMHQDLYYQAFNSRIGQVYHGTWFSIFHFEIRQPVKWRRTMQFGIDMYMLWQILLRSRV